MAHLFICPNCGRRSSESERTAGFRNMPKGCSNCGFGFLFELLDDYYPAPNAAFFTCDQQGRIIACGRGSKELTGLSDEKTIGRPVIDVLGPAPVDDGLVRSIIRFEYARGAEVAAAVRAAVVKEHEHV